MATSNILISPSLLKGVSIQKGHHPNFCIGLSDFCICANCKNEPPTTRTRLRLSTKNASRVASPCSEDKLKEIAKGNKSKNTERNTSWAVNVFRD